MTDTTSPANADRAPRWERRKESRPAELLDAALELFVERGYAATRLEDVASRAGVSKGTLYLYYANKEELFRAVVSETIVPLIERFREDVERSDAPAAKLLERFFTEWWGRFGSTRLAGIAKLIVSEAGNFPEVAQFFYQAVVRPNTALLAMILQRGVDRGEFRAIDVPTAVHLWMSPLVMKAIWTHSMQPCCPPEDVVDPERFVRLHVDSVLRALAKRKPR